MFYPLKFIYFILIFIIVKVFILTNYFLYLILNFIFIIIHLVNLNFYTNFQKLNFNPINLYFYFLKLYQ